MGRLWDKFRSLMATNGKDIIIFVMSLLLAFSIWLIHNLPCITTKRSASL